MTSVQASLRKLIDDNEFLQFGLANDLFNLSKTARFIQRDLEVRLKRNISVSALTMALSRLSQEQETQRIKVNRIELRNLQVASNLAILTYEHSKTFRPQIVEMARGLQQAGKFISLSQGLNQITLFVTRDDVATVERHISLKPLHVHHTVAVIGARLHSSAIQTPGFFFAIFQQLYMQHINVLEISSTSSELLIYVDENDLPIAFDSLYQRFVKAPAPQHTKPNIKTP